MKELQNLKSSNNNNLLVILPVNKIEDYFLNESLYALAESKYPIDLLVLTHNINENDKKLLTFILEKPRIFKTEKNKDGSPISKEIYSKNDINFVIEDSASDTFNKIFNEGTNYAIINNYKYFSVIEYDDIINSASFQNFNTYAESKPNIDGFMPLTREIANGGFIGFFHEAPWVDGLAEVPGIFDLTLLLKYNCMNITGAIFKTESIKRFSEKVGEIYKPIKESIKMGYIYEFFLRMIYNDLKFYSIPRIGYEHRVDRPGMPVDYFSTKIPKDIVIRSVENGGISQEEAKFWTDLVKKEYYFEEDRKLQFQK